MTSKEEPGGAKILALDSGENRNGLANWPTVRVKWRDRLTGEFLSS